MRKVLEQDQASGELRLVFRDFWQGEHEQTEYRVIGSDGAVLRGRDAADWHGVTVQQASMGGWQAIRRPGGPVHPFQVEDRPALQEKAPCRRLASKSGRARCSLCEVAA